MVSNTTSSGKAIFHCPEGVFLLADDVIDIIIQKVFIVESQQFLVLLLQFPYMHSIQGITVRMRNLWEVELALNHLHQFITMKPEYSCVRKYMPS